jgi:hypothetical protein
MEPEGSIPYSQEPSTGDNLNHIRRETSRHFRNKKREYLKDEIDELATNNKNKNIRDLYRAGVGNLMSRKSQK